MKIGIMSDSHDNLPLIAKAMELFNREQVDLEAMTPTIVPL